MSSSRSVTPKEFTPSRKLESDRLYPASNRPDWPSRKLALGILMQAFRDLLSNSRASNQEARMWRQDAQEWFQSREHEPGSFVWVCDILRLSASPLREWTVRNGDLRPTDVVRRLRRVKLID